MIAQTQSPWRKLAELPGAKGVLAEWGNFPEKFLTLTQETATAVPCGTPGRCYRRVIQHQDGELVGVCSSYPVQCDRVSLDRMDVAIYRLNHKCFFEVVTSTIGGRPAMEKLDWVPNLWRIGAIGLYADKSVPVFQSFAARTSDIDRAVNAISMRHSEPFLLLLPAAATASTVAYEMAERFRGKILGLDDLFAVFGSSDIKARRDTLKSIEQWVQSLIPESSKPGSEFIFPTPAGTIWENIKMEFTADEKLIVSCGSISKTLEPEHLRMKDQRTGRPMEQWIMLKAFALKNGEIDWSKIPERDKPVRKKQKQELSKKLKRVFQISTDPISWNRGDCSYICRFRITESLPKGSRDKEGLVAEVA